ncbi:MAG: hypothetical protein MMC33_008612 [Icmadophila ericetorum]|nr:hypothetical protein [Icmadophila ericetorum]
METEGYPNCAALKSHKVLPRSRIISNGVKNSTKNGLRLGTLQNYNGGGDGLSRQIHRWIPEPPQMHNAVAKSLPLTPPLLTRDDEKVKSLHSAHLLDARELTNGADRTSDISTPVNQRSPPTPDTTPPRQSNKTTALSPPFLGLQVASSRTESFQTAREQLSSDDEDQHSSVPSSYVLPRKWLSNSRATDLRDIGLGLDFESTDEGSTSAPAPRKRHHQYDAFLAFDGSWGNNKEDANDTSSSATELGAQHSKIVARKTMREQDSTIGTVSETRAKGHASDHTNSVSPLQKAAQKSRNSSLNDSAEHSVGANSQPSQEDADLDAKIRQIDNRRLSQMSAASTVVEALVVDKTPQRRHTLRHTSKNLSLRNVSLTSNDSNRSSVISTTEEPVHRLIHHKKKLSQTGHRYSTMSDNILTAGSTFAKDYHQSLPVEAVPQRRSSLKASNAEIPQRTPGQTRLRRTSRPATAPEGTVEDQEYLRGRLRTRAPIMFPNMSKPNRSKTRQLPPAIPTRSSSLSAPTSRNVSRTTSLTSTSLHAHNMQLESQLSQPQPAIEAPTEAPAEVPVAESRPSLSADRSGEYWSSLHPPSMRLTPFSLASIQSSTPGTLEVNEATAISIYPHNNKSILVVQQIARQDSDDTPERFATIVESTNINTTEPLTPPPTARPKQQVDSPLRNPREAPEPPAFTIIPPTPIPPNRAATEGSSRSASVSTGSGRFGIVRRALSARRYSESFISPLARSLSKRNPPTTRRHNINDDATNNKLSPFWRPRGFWDDLSESESDFGNDGLLVHNANDKSLKRTISGGAASIGRRFGSLKQKYAAPRFDRNGIQKDRTWTQESTTGNRWHDHQGRNQNTSIMAKLGNQVQIQKSFSAIHDRFEQWQTKRSEEKREKERARLRRSIGTIIVHPDARIV